MSPEHRNRSSLRLAAEAPTPLWRARATIESLATFHVVKSSQLLQENSMYHIFSDEGAPFYDYCLVNQPEFIQKLTKRAGG